MPVSAALLKSIVDQNIESLLIVPGKPWQNGTTGSFNGKFRDEFSALAWFRNRIEAEAVIWDWRQRYNAVRPPSSLKNETPEAFGRKQSET